MKLLSKLWQSANAQLTSLRHKAVWLWVWLQWKRIPKPRPPKEPECEWARDIPLTKAYILAEIRHHKMRDVLSRAPKHMRGKWSRVSSPSLNYSYLLDKAKPVIVENWNLTADEALDEIRLQMSKRPPRRKRYGNHPPNKSISSSPKS